MPKKLDYPLAEFNRCLDVAGAVYSFGHQVEKERCAEKLGKKVSGAFQTLLSAAVKFQLITNSKGVLNFTPLYSAIALSYSEEEKRLYLRESFLKVPPFQQLLQKLSQEPIAAKDIEKVLVKELWVDLNDAKKVAKIFIEGATQLGLVQDKDSFIIGNAAAIIEVADAMASTPSPNTRGIQHDNQHGIKHGIQHGGKHDVKNGNSVVASHFQDRMKNMAAGVHQPGSYQAGAYQPVPSESHFTPVFSTRFGQDSELSEASLHRSASGSIRNTGINSSIGSGTAQKNATSPSPIHSAYQSPYYVKIVGNNLNLELNLTEESDFSLLEHALQKIRSKWLNN